ncbi:MAG: response regulator transcription factor [Bacteroidetes bacterium]|nr:response regulator transcription factor [Bacteroidota bacterium]
MEEQTILLVEDDFLNRRLCRKVLVDNAYRVLEAKNASEARSILNKEKIELAILDINLGEGERSGITIGQELAEQYGVPFLYLTAYDNPEIINRAIATTPYAYVTKPFKSTDLLTSVALAIRQGTKPNRGILTIMVKDGEFNVDLPLADINYIESDGNYLRFYTNKMMYKSRSTVQQILEILPPTTFIRTHRAYIVNKNKIDKWSAKKLVVNQMEIPVSANYVPDINFIGKNTEE